MRIPLIVVGMGAIALAATRVGDSSAATPGSPGVAERYDIRSVTLPIVGQSLGSPVIELTVNGAGPFRFRFDTGSGDLINGRSATAAHLQPTSSTRLVEINRSDVTTGVADDTLLGAGRFKLANVALVLMPPEWPGSAEFDGVVGHALLKSFVVTLDGPNGRLTLTDPRDYQPPPGSIILPMEERAGVFTIDACVDGNCGRFELDTGFDRDVALSSRFHLSTATRERYATGGVEAKVAGQSGHSSPARQVQGGVLELAGMQLPEPDVLLLDGASDALDQSDLSGLIGAPALKEFETTFDAPHGRLVLRRTGPETRVHHGRGFDVEATAAGLVVRRVIRGGPAWHADLRDGDVIIRVDGFAPVDFPDGLWRQFWTAAPGSVDTVEVKRPRGRLTKKLVSIDWQLHP